MFFDFEANGLADHHQQISSVAMTSSVGSKSPAIPVSALGLSLKPLTCILEMEVMFMDACSIAPKPLTL